MLIFSFIDCAFSVKFKIALRNEDILASLIFFWDHFLSSCNTIVSSFFRKGQMAAVSLSENCPYFPPDNYFLRRYFRTVFYIFP